MPSGLTERIKQVILDSSRSANIQDEFTCDLLRRYERIAEELEARNPRSIEWIKTISDIAITFGGVIVGFVTGNNTVTGLAAWILVMGFLVFAGLICVISRYFPDDPVLLRSMFKRIRLGLLVERLAAQIAVFDSISEISYVDEDKTIARISSFVNELNDPKNRLITPAVMRCLDQQRDILNSRDTNAKVSLNLPVAKQREVHDGIAQVAYLAEKLFPGKTFSAKLYLRVRKRFQESDEVEILVSFARYITGNDNTHLGTSWIKARGNPSFVWRCLEMGREQIGSDGGYNSYYDSILAVCLPNRIGVLALTSNQVDAFSSVQNDATVIKTLQLCGKELARSILA